MLSAIPGIENLSPAVKYVIAFAIIFLLLALFALVLRRLTGGRLTLTNERGRARQPRLGIVDVYDLDRQRQLILLRRDNVEHLLLVGGPNDVVVETNIVRVPGARLPAGAENGTEAPAPERPPEIAPVRPVIEPPAAAARIAPRPSEPVVAGHLGRAETAPAAVPGPVRSAAPARGEQPIRPAPAASVARGPERSRQTPQPAQAAPSAPASGNGGSARPTPAPVARMAGGPTPPPEEGRSRPPMPDMARQLEDALTRSDQPSPVQRSPDAASAPIGSRAPVAAAPGLARPDPRPQPPIRSVSPPTPGGQAGPAREAGIAGPATNPAPATPEASPEPADGAPPPGPASTQAAPAPAASPEPPRRPEAAPEPPAQSARPDPFSIEDIEAEFARLLGRPLDRKDGKP